MTTNYVLFTKNKFYNRTDFYLLNIRLVLIKKINFIQGYYDEGK